MNRQYVIEEIERLNMVLRQLERDIHAFGDELTAAGLNALKLAKANVERDLDELGREIHGKA